MPNAACRERPSPVSVLQSGRRARLRWRGSRGDAVRRRLAGGGGISRVRGLITRGCRAAAVPCRTVSRFLAAPSRPLAASGQPLRRFQILGSVAMATSASSFARLILAQRHYFLIR